jgi:cellulose synthase operon protein C
VSLQPKSPAGPLRLTDLHLANKDYNAARQSIQRAQDLAPGAPEILQRRIAIEMAAGRTPDALVVARAEQKRNPKSGFGLSLEGDVQLAAKNWEGAATAYKAALKITPAPQLALKVHTALQRGGKTAEAGAFAQGWLKEHPNDVAFIGYQADLSLAAKDNATAERLYEDVLKLQPTNARALNNIAWLKLQSGAAGALSYAEKANQLAPRNPALMDTLAQVHLAEKRNDDAVKLLKQALEIDPEAHGIRMTLARAYIAAGEKGHAKDELDRLSKLGDKFREQPEVSRLLGGL